MDTWEQVNSELTRCILCGAEFRIGDGESPCGCAPPPATESNPGAHTSLSVAAAETVRDIGASLYWRAKFHEYDDGLKLLLGELDAITTSDVKEAAVEVSIVKTKTVVYAELRKNAHGALQASLPDKHDDEVKELRTLVERMEAATRRSRAH